MGLNPLISKQIGPIGTWFCFSMFVSQQAVNDENCSETNIEKENNDPIDENQKKNLFG